MDKRVPLKVSIPQNEILTSTKQLNLQMGGQRSGKTHLIGLISAMFILKFPRLKGFIGANTYLQLTQSTIVKTTEIWKDFFNLTEYNSKSNPRGQYVIDKIPPPHFKRFTNYKDYHNIISFVNGGSIFIGSLDNYKAHDGKEFAWADLDETKDTKKEALTSVILGRLNQKGLYVDTLTCEKVYIDPDTDPNPDPILFEPLNPIYIHTSPAEGQVDWLIEMFELNGKEDEIYKALLNPYGYYVMETALKKVVIYSTYHNEDNLPANYIENRKAQLSEKEQLKFIYGYPFSKGGGEFWHSFDRLTHTREDIDYVPDTSIHITLDFNVVPYMTLLVWQVVKNADIYELRCIDEYCLPHPKNNTESVCEEFAYDYETMIEELYYYGDPSGRARNTETKDIEHNYTVLENVLSKYLNRDSDRVLRNHPGLIKSRDFINKILSGKFPFRILINRKRCPNLIADMEFLKQDKDGKPLKEVVKNKSTGESYQKYGHTSDAMRYFICKILEDIMD